MTTTTAFLQLINDLSRTLPTTERYHRLLTCIKEIYPCDAICLLQLQDQYLIPLAILGLSEDTLGRQFKIDQQPRLKTIVDNAVPTRFPSDSPLADPFDGLMSEEKHNLIVDDCFGIPLIIDGKIWGVLTLDALNPNQFDNLVDEYLDTLVSIVCATVKAVSLITALEYRANNNYQLDSMSSPSAGSHDMIGNSPAMKHLQQEINTVAPSLLSVLILGETGVGKEVVAQQIHQHSSRSQQPLVYINCAALPESIAESELFGHSKGSFTGAVEHRSGKFEIADGGTLFLDELGELPLTIQAKLLRAIQSGEIQRVGSDKAINVDVRIIAATNRNLKNEITEGRFRADLYHRLSVFPITIPPLRDRGNDIVLLAGFLLEREQHRLGIQRIRLTKEAQQALQQYSWPGNVRELEHLLSRAALRASHEQHNVNGIISVGYEHLNISTGSQMLTAEDSANKDQTVFVTKMTSENEIVDLKQATEDYQRELILRQLKQHNNNMAATARSLSLDKSNFYRLIKRLGIQTKK